MELKALFELKGRSAVGVPSGGLRECGGLKRASWDFPGGTVVKTPSSQCKGPGFDPWSGN